MFAYIYVCMKIVFNQQSILENWFLIITYIYDIILQMILKMVEPYRDIICIRYTYVYSVYN